MKLDSEIITDYVEYKIGDYVVVRNTTDNFIIEKIYSINFVHIEGFAPSVYYNSNSTEYIIRKATPKEIKLFTKN